MKYPSELSKLIQQLRRFPGVGYKSAERFAFSLLEWDDFTIEEFGETLLTLKKKLPRCDDCGLLKDQNSCPVCDSRNRDHQTLCIVAHLKDLFTIETTNSYKGFYHVLGGLLSPLENRGPDTLAIKKIDERILKNNVKEVILALDATLEGDTTALYIKQQLSRHPIVLSRLAFGLPIGTSFDYVDSSALAKALQARSAF